MQRRPKKLLDQVRETIRLKHYSIRTEEAYVKFVQFTLPDPATLLMPTAGRGHRPYTREEIDQHEWMGD